jgi:D-alanine-D-alanine ligase-like ATP-grasp enzyme
VILEVAAAVVAALPNSARRPLGPLVIWSFGLDRLQRRSPASRAALEQRAAFYDAMWTAAATKLGLQARRLTGNVFEIATNDARTRVNLNETAADDPVTLRLAGDKPTVHRELASAGIPVPSHVAFSVSDRLEAEKFMAQSDRSCVVKPALSGWGGRGVTTGVRSRRGLVLACVRAAIWGSDLLIEREVEGENYRLLFLDGVLLDAFVRRRPVVHGDGERTIGELVRRENAARVKTGASAAQTILTVDADMVSTLRRQKLRLSSIPEAGRHVVVKSVVNENAAGENEACASRITDSIVETARAAAVVLGVRLAGVDVITSDIGRPLSETGGVILEVNTTPGLYHHYHRAGEPADVAVPILAALLATAGESRGRQLAAAESPASNSY